MSGDKLDVSKAVFEINEKVLCYHGPLIYEAKVLNIDFKKDTFTYLVHYTGWSKKWDEYIPEDKVLKFSNENIQKQKEKKRALEDDKRQAKKSITPKISLGKKTPTSLKRSKNSSISDTSSEVSGGINSTPTSRASTPINVDTKEPVKITAATGSTTTTSQTPIIPKTEPTSSHQSTTEPETAADTSSTPAAVVLKEKIKDEKPPILISNVAVSAPVVQTETPTPTIEKRSKRRIIEAIDFENVNEVKIDVKINIPEKLKIKLVDDWECINLQKKLLKIPTPESSTITSICSDYINAHKDIMEKKFQVIDGIKDFFNLNLGHMLLYKYERLQYVKIVKEIEFVSNGEDEDEDKKPNFCDFYGFPHLLRSFGIGKIAETLSYGELQKPYLDRVMDDIHHFLGYLEDKIDKYTIDYIISEPEYQKKLAD